MDRFLREVLERGPKAHIWSVAVGTRHIECAHLRCKERGIQRSGVASKRSVSQPVRD